MLGIVPGVNANECVSGGADPGLTHFWLSPSATNPNFADTPLVNSSSPSALYIWARLAESQSITDLSLEVATTGDAILSSAALDNLPVDSPDDIVRFEVTPKALVSDHLAELHGFTLGDRGLTGKGLGPATKATDPHYNVAVAAWRIGKIELGGGNGTASLRIGRNGLQGVDANGDVTPLYSIVFGDETDEPLCALDQRHLVSSREDAVVQTGTIDAAAIGVLEGSLLLGSDGALKLATESAPWSVKGEAFVAGRAMVQVSDPFPARGTTKLVELLSAIEVIGQFDELFVNEQEIAETTHFQNGVFQSLQYDTSSVYLKTHSALVGDADGNGTVEFGDFLILSSNFGTQGNWPKGDFDGDSDIAFADFLLLSKNFGNSAAAQVANAPEPNCGWLLFVWLVFMRKKIAPAVPGN